jgi:pimeloyl-ACP methyl ester carboxylesterase
MIHKLTLEGGPGGSGVDFVLHYGSDLLQLVGTQYNLIGFDPRGVNNSGPVVDLDCFLNNSDARAAFQNNFFTDVSNASSTSTGTQYYAADFFGKWCTEAIRKENGRGQYVSTPAVAQDMLSYIKAEQKAAGKNETDAKLWYYGVSYGTVLGVTFASLFPDHVGRLIVDGVLDAEDYYNNGWKSNLFDADKAMDSFSTFCHESGPNNCSFWGPSVQNITDRLDNILAELKDNPIPVLGLQPSSTPGLTTYSDLKQILLSATYAPLQRFPSLSDILLDLEQGNGSAAVTGSEWTLGPDINTLVKCVDGYARTNFTKLDDYEEYIELLEGQSKYFGEVWPNNADGVLCRSLDLDLPHGSFPGAQMKLSQFLSLKR